MFAAVLHQMETGFIQNVVELNILSQGDILSYKISSGAGFVLIGYYLSETGARLCPRVSAPGEDLSLGYYLHYMRERLCPRLHIVPGRIVLRISSL